MAVKYSNMLFIRLTHEDRRRIEKASEKVEIPPSTLARKVLRQWLQSAEVAPTLMEEIPSSITIGDHISSKKPRKTR